MPKGWPLVLFTVLYIIASFFLVRTMIPTGSLYVQYSVNIFYTGFFFTYSRLMILRSWKFVLFLFLHLFFHKPNLIIHTKLL